MIDDYRSILWIAPNLKDNVYIYMKTPEDKTTNHEGLHQKDHTTFLHLASYATRAAVKLRYCFVTDVAVKLNGRDSC